MSDPLSSAFNAAVETALLAVQTGRTDPIGALRELTITLTETDALTPDEARDIHAALDRQHAEAQAVVEQTREDNIRLRDRAATYTDTIAALEAQLGTATTKQDRLADENAILADQLRTAQAKLTAVRQAGDENHDLAGAESDECHPGCPGCLIAAALGEHEMG